MKMIFGEEVCFACTDEAPLAWVSFAIEAGALWFLGRTVWNFRVTHKTTPEGHGFAMRSDRGLVHPLNWSADTQINALVAAKAFPVRLTVSFSPKTGTGKTGGIGPVTYYDENQTVIAFHDLHPDTRIVTLAYGFADSCIDFFKRGAGCVRGQWSLERSEIVADVGLSRHELAELASDTPSYTLTETAAQLR